jgi:hypothetical protein
MYTMPGFQPLNYGGCGRGIFSAACPVKALHTLENGLIKESLMVLMYENLSLSGQVLSNKVSHGPHV